MAENSLSPETLSKIRERIKQLRSAKNKTPETKKTSLSGSNTGLVTSAFSTYSWSAATYNGQFVVLASVNALQGLQACMISAAGIQGGQPYAYGQMGSGSEGQTTALLSASTTSSPLPAAGGYVASTISGTTSSGSFSYTQNIKVYDVALRSASTV